MAEIINGAKEFVGEIQNPSRKEELMNMDYGHAFVCLGNVIDSRARFGDESKELQLSKLKKDAEELVKKHGVKILNVMRDKLRFAYSNEELGIKD